MVSPREVLLKLILKDGGLSGAAQRAEEKGVSACLSKEDPPPALSSSICPHLLPAGGEMGHSDMGNMDPK